MMITRNMFVDAGNKGDAEAADDGDYGVYYNNSRIADAAFVGHHGGDYDGPGDDDYDSNGDNAEFAGDYVETSDDVDMNHDHDHAAYEEYHK